MLSIPTQYSILEAFSLDNVENIKKIGLSLYGNFKNSFTIPLEFRSVVSGNPTDLSITISDFTKIVLSSGRCEILGTLIEIKQQITLDSNNISCYLFPDDDDCPISIPGHGAEIKPIYVAIYYNPTSLAMDASVGLVVNLSLIEYNKINLCVLGAPRANMNDNLVVSFDNTNIDYGRRDVLFDIFDGGEI